MIMEIAAVDIFRAREDMWKYVAQRDGIADCYRYRQRGKLAIGGAWKFGTGSVEECNLPAVRCLPPWQDTARPWDPTSCWESRSEYCAGTNVSRELRCDQVRAGDLAEIDKLFIG